jgi:hypothetical protein
VNDLNEFFGGEGLWSLTPHLRVDHVFANVIFNDLRDESVQGASASGGLLKDSSALIVRIDGPFDRLDLAPQSLEPIQQFDLFFRNMTHDSNLLLLNYTTVEYPCLHCRRRRSAHYGAFYGRWRD